MSRTPGVTIVRLAAGNGFEVGIADLGATIAFIRVPVGGVSRDVALRYEDPNAWMADPYHLGSTLGRYANRIRGGRFELNDERYHLATRQEDHGHTLHGGPNGFSRRRFQLDRAPGGRRVTCRYISSHGEEGFPARLDVAVEYRLIGDGALVIDYTATADRATVVNLSNHAYFNLDGDGGTIGNHELTVFASRYTPVDDEMIPTGEIASVDGTPFDFRRPVQLGERLAGAGGLDTNFAIDEGDGDSRHVARLESPATGLRLDVNTTQPGLQVFTGQNLEAPFRRYGGICLETQNFPDAPNQPDFPSATLLAGETYRQRTVYEFSEIA